MLYSITMNGTQTNPNPNPERNDAMTSFVINPNPSASSDLCVRMTGYTEAQLESAFAMVKPSTHWKDAIRAIVKADAVTIACIKAAVAHYTATEAEAIFHADKGVWTVKADGYWAGPAN
jgi:hypothetical protein